MPVPSPGVLLLAKTWAMKLGALAPLCMKTLPKGAMPLPSVRTSNNGVGNKGEVVGCVGSSGTCGCAKVLGGTVLGSGTLIRYSGSPASCALMT
ncbi:hypothetical protein D3C71_1973370 [compost metagenome]